MAVQPLSTQTQWRDREGVRFCPGSPLKPSSTLSTADAGIRFC